MNSHDLALFVYNLSLIPIILFSVLFLLLSIINLLISSGENSSRKIVYKKIKHIPFVTVQIPTYNDPVAERCVKQCLTFDYPKNKYEIIIADDSTNIETQKLLKKYANQYPNFVKYVHRNNREHFKPGALKNTLKITNGEIIVIFDSDWIPKKNFLKRIIEPFSDPKIAIVQSGQGIYNKNANLITRFATYLMMTYHKIVMPINNRINCVFFCGTAGAIRKSALLEVGGWNVNSITEDSDLTINLLLNGYKSIYLDFETPSEVPDTFESFIKQQMRWCYGNVRAFIDNAHRIFFNSRLKIPQKIMILYVTLGNLIAPFVVIMTLSGFLGWFLGEIVLFNINDLVKFFSVWMYTSGFLLMGIIVLYKKRQLYDFPYFLLSALSIGIVLAVANSIAFFLAIANQKLSWFCTPKIANDSFVKNESS